MHSVSVTHQTATMHGQKNKCTKSHCIRSHSVPPKKKIFSPNNNYMTIQFSFNWGFYSTQGLLFKFNYPQWLQKGQNVCLYSLHLFQLSLFSVYTMPWLLKENTIDVIMLLLFTYRGKKTNNNRSIHKPSPSVSALKLKFIRGHFPSTQHSAVWRGQKEKKCNSTVKRKWYRHERKDWRPRGARLRSEGPGCVMWRCTVCWSRPKISLSTNAEQHKAAPMREELLEELWASNNSSKNNGLQPSDMSIKADPGLLTTPCLPVQKRHRTHASISFCYPWPNLNPKRPPLFFPTRSPKIEATAAKEGCLCSGDHQWKCLGT